MGANLIDAGGLSIEIKIFFAYFFAICWYAPTDQPPPKLAETNKIPVNDESIKCSSKPTGPIKQRLKKI